MRKDQPLERRVGLFGCIGWGKLVESENEPVIERSRDAWEHKHLHFHKLRRLAAHFHKIDTARQSGNVDL